MEIQRGGLKRCPTCGAPERRSSAANARLWSLLNLLSRRLRVNGTSYGAETWHHYFKQEFLGNEEIRLPNGKLETVTRSSAALPADLFSEYLAKVEAWAAERGVYLPDREGLE